MRRTAVVIGLLLWSATIAAPAETKVPLLAEGEIPVGSVLAFDDEFDGSAVRPHWKRSLPHGARWMAGEEQIYHDGSAAGPPDPITLRDGVMSIAPRRLDEALEGQRYLSGLLSTEGAFEFRYGFVEARIKLPKGQGLWPAFWLFPGQGDRPYGEIDIVESLGADPGRAYGTVHAGPVWKARSMSQFSFRNDPDFSRDFHVFALDWDDRHITFYVDGLEMGWVTTPPELKRPMFVILDVAVGGRWAGAPDEVVDDRQPLQIDYVRVWTKPPEDRAQRPEIAPE